ncbi:MULTISPECIES: hypothetical protein [Acidovorax]|uniref:Uncharacterized protein n=1 Tax=Acidovorax carolinensis TaxID=553814 RepID=A0A240UB97_9BURK|nr:MULTISPECIES: hypothetical protein [Acidovorax]ART47570.1 hypothetical protein CBP33_05035 [Acidovorax carolinensis]ART55747.1 hypothetical protein CBP35_13465 [Acidovorax carolinensis]ART58386.1 hypothetical protein CBP36_05470 [Acidovorax carolinensis]MBP3979924.1 hypothetical protein [Acidovorax sp. JG5]
MPTLYQIGAAGYWTGATQTVASAANVPSGWTARPVPQDVPEGHYVRLTLAGWETTAEPAPEALIAEPQAVPELRRITKRAFRSRFTKPERTAIEWAAVDRPELTTEQRMQAAALRSDLKDQEQATYIDLDDPDVELGVQTLEAIGLLDAGRTLEIINAPVQSEELP